MQVYWNKRKRFHKKRVQFPQDWSGTPTWLPFHCFGTPIWPPWRYVYSQTSNKRPAKMHRVSTSGSLMGGGCLQESNHWGSLPSQGQASPTFWKIIILLRAICLVPCSTKSSLYTVSNTVNAANVHHVITYKRLNARENNKNVSTQKWLWLLTGGGRLWESSSVRLWERKVWCFG